MGCQCSSSTAISVFKRNLTNSGKVGSEELSSTVPRLSLCKKTVWLKGTALRVTLSDPPCKDGNTRFTTVPLKALSGQLIITYKCLTLKPDYFQLWVL